MDDCRVVCPRGTPLQETMSLYSLRLLGRRGFPDSYRFAYLFMDDVSGPGWWQRENSAAGVEELPCLEIERGDDRAVITELPGARRAFVDNLTRG